MDYSVLTYNIGGYEILHEIKEKSDRAEYIYVTDDKTITSSTWTMVYVDNPHPEDNFDLCYKIRFNPFDYVHTDVVVRIDGSMGINRSLDPIVDFFNNGFDMAVCIHPTRANLYDEYIAWITQRGYDPRQAEWVLNFLQGMEGYNVKKDIGLYQYNFMIQRRNKLNMALNSMTLSFLRYLAPEGKEIERVDQTVGSFVINKYFPMMKIMPVDQSLFDGRYFTWYQHNSDNAMTCGAGTGKPMMLGHEITTMTFD